MATRTQLKAALTRIFEQGEAAWKLSSDSHFYRFATIHDELKSIIKEKEKAGKTDWRPTYQVAENPHTVPSTAKSSLSLITWSRSKQWADLFDLRYGLLLSYLIHTFKLARNERDARLRGAVVHRVFGEMYNLKAIAGILVKLPLRDPADPQRAGPPFSIPESLKLPSDPTERWETHRCQLKKAQLLTGELNAALSDSTGTPEQETAYLQGLRSQDKDAVEWIDKVIAGLQAKGVVAP
jgi:hypothetical protein